MPLVDLVQAIQNKRKKGASAIPERMELHQRIAFAFAPLVFCLLGVALTLLPRNSRTHRSWGFTLCLFWFLIYYVLLSLGKAAGDKGLLHPALALWLPNIVVAGIALHLFSKALRESPLLLPAKMEAVLLKVGQRFASASKTG